MAILSLYPWLLPWDEIKIPYLPTIHVIASVAPWIGSTLYHLFMSRHNDFRTYKILLTLDVLGIWVTQTLGALGQFTKLILFLDIFPFFQAV